MISLSSCKGGEPEMNKAYQQITAKEAKEIMDEETGYLILDVRRQDEFDAGHIPGAVLLPNESIGTADIPSLPDKDQKILIYCRSGNRSKQAAQKLSNLGYTNLYEFGGIIDWPYEIEQ
jgi:rhodanese-related sulfurtransferase